MRPIFKAKAGIVTLALYDLNDPWRPPWASAKVCWKLANSRARFSRKYAKMKPGTEFYVEVIR